MQIIVKLEEKNFKDKPEVFEALRHLSEAATGRMGAEDDNADANTEVSKPQTEQEAVSNQTVPVQPPREAPPVSSAAHPVQTPPIAASVTYDLAQVSQAAAIFAETSPECRKKVVDTIKTMGVNALTEMSPEQLGAFATTLRGMGARI